jgi:hypothetical protein
MSGTPTHAADRAREYLQNSDSLVVHVGSCSATAPTANGWWFLPWNPADEQQRAHARACRKCLPDGLPS